MPNICKSWSDGELLRQSKDEYNKKCRRISIKNMPQGISNQDILDLLKPYYYQQIHIDKTSQSCKAVLLNGESAMRCINDLNLKPFKGTNLNVSLASCDFMLCITQLPLMYSLEQFQTLITPFGTAERCFLVHSEENGECKGYGCVEFTSKESSIKAKNQLNGKKIGVQVLQVHWLDSIPTDYSGLHSKCLYIENLPYNFKDNEALTKMFSIHAVPVFCKLASSTKDDFAVVEYANHLMAEESWRACNGKIIGGIAIRVSFCVPGPCGLVILNSLCASRDLKRNNPCGGLLPTPVQQITDHQRVQMMHQKINQSKGLLHYDNGPIPLNNVDGTIANAASHTDPEVQRLLKALQVRLLHVPPDNECHMMNGGGMPQSTSAHAMRQISASTEGLQAHNTVIDTKNLCGIKSSNHLLPLRSHRGRSASYDSGVHTVDEDVFSSNNSSQEDVQQQSIESSDFHPQYHAQYYSNQQQQYVGWSNGNQNDIATIKRSWKSMQPLTYDNVLYCKREELQRSDSADSAYGGSQESASSLSEATYHYGNTEWQINGHHKSKSFGQQHFPTMQQSYSGPITQQNEKLESQLHVPSTTSYQSMNGVFQNQVANGINEFHPGVMYHSQSVTNTLTRHPNSNFDPYKRDQTYSELIQADKKTVVTSSSNLPRPEFLEVSTTGRSSTNQIENLPIFTNSFLPNKFKNCKIDCKSTTTNSNHEVSTPNRVVSSAAKSIATEVLFTTPRMCGKNNLGYNLRDIGADSPTQLQLLGSSLMEGLFGDSPRSAAGSMSLSSSLNTPACEPGRLIHALNLFSPSDLNLIAPHTPLMFRRMSLENVLPSPEPSPEAGAYVGQHSQGLGGHYAESPLLLSILHKRRKSNDT